MTPFGELDLREARIGRRVAELVVDLVGKVGDPELEDVGLSREFLERHVVGRLALQVRLLGELGRVDRDDVRAHALLEEDRGALVLARVEDVDVEVIDVLEELEGDLFLGFEREARDRLFIGVGDDLALRLERDRDVLDLLHEVERKEVLGADVELGQLLELLGRIAERDPDELFPALVLELDRAGHRDPGFAAHEIDQRLLVIDLGLEIGRLDQGEFLLGGQPLLLELERAIEIALGLLQLELGLLERQELHRLGLLLGRERGEPPGEGRGRR